jgi:uncharacterized membrane protein
MKMRKALMIIPIMTILANLAIFVNISPLREVIVFAFLSFVPGYAFLRLFKLKEINIIETILFSVGLSIALVMFTSLLLNEASIVLDFSRPLSTIPLTLAISAITLVPFFIECRRGPSETINLKTNFEGQLKNVVPVSIIIVLLPLLSAIGVLYLNTPIILLSYAIIAALCVMSVVSRRLIPTNLFPLMIFSVSLALVFQLPLTSKYILGYDANLEYYVFRVTQINGHWGFLNSSVNPLAALTYNSMLSITLLPTAYAALMQVQGEIVFKILYPFIFSLVPLALYRVCEKQLGKMVGLFSSLFFVFTSTAFYSEPLSLNRQIVGEFFLILSIFLLISKTIPTTKARLLLIIFGAALAVSHYSIAYIYLALVAIVFVVSKVKPKFNGVLNLVTVLLLFGITFSWYALTSAPLLALFDALKGVFVAITTGVTITSGAAASLIFIPQVFTATTWINLLLSGLAYLFLIIGVLLIIVRPKGTGIFPQYGIMVIIAAIILAVTYLVPSIAATLNFVRFYGILLLFLAPCFVLGGQWLLVTIGRHLKKMNRSLTRQITLKTIKVDIIFLLIAIILGAYFLSQVGFINNVTNSAIHSYTIDFNRSKTSSNTAVEINFYTVYTPEQDVFSAVWLLNHEAAPSMIYCDYVSGAHVLTSYGLTPWKIDSQITNSTKPLPNTLVYLSFLNVADNTITTYSASFNTSQVYPNLKGCDLVYSNGNGEIWYPSLR